MILTKNIVLLGGAAGTALGGGSIYLGHRIYNDAYPNGNWTLYKEGYKWNIPSPNMGTNAYWNPSKVFYDKEPKGCFQNFFPGAKVNRYMPKQTTVEKNGSLPTLTEETLVSTSGIDPIGCALMDFSFYKEDDSKNKWAFNSEVTVRNDNFGWVLWTTGRKENEDISLFYCLVLLKKTGDNWAALGGYVWSDSGFFAGQEEVWPHIKHPPINGASSENWFDKSKALSSGSVLNERYSGIWTKDDKGKEVFEEIEVRGSSGTDSSFEILGIKDSTFSYKQDRGYGSVNIGYDKASNGWFKFNDSSGSVVDISSSLNKFYKPFKDKKGKWTEFSEVKKKCTSLYYATEIEEENKKYLRNFCYMKR